MQTCVAQSGRWSLWPLTRCVVFLVVFLVFVGSSWTTKVREVKLSAPSQMGASRCPPSPWGFCHNHRIFVYFLSFFSFSSHPTNNSIFTRLLATLLATANQCLSIPHSPIPFGYSAIPILSSFCLDPTTTRECRHSPAILVPFNLRITFDICFDQLVLCWTHNKTAVRY